MHDITKAEQHNLDKKIAKLCGLDQLLTTEFPRVHIGENTCWLQNNGNDECKDLVRWRPTIDRNQAMMVVKVLNKLNFVVYMASGAEQSGVAISKAWEANPQGMNWLIGECGTEPLLICRLAITVLKEI